MSLRLATQKFASRTPIVFTRSVSGAVYNTSGADPSRIPPHDQWMASLASASEEAVKADRTAWGASGANKYKCMQEKTKRVAEEMKDSRDSTASLTDGLWRSIGGGR